MYRKRYGFIPLGCPVPLGPRSDLLRPPFGIARRQRGDVRGPSGPTYGPGGTSLRDGKVNFSELGIAELIGLITKDVSL